MALFWGLVFALLSGGLLRWRRRRTFPLWLPPLLVTPATLAAMVAMGLILRGRPGLRLGIMWGGVAALGFVAYWWPATRIGSRSSGSSRSPHEPARIER